MQQQSCRLEACSQIHFDMEAANASCGLGVSAHCRFDNDDDCGDFVFGYGTASKIQLINALSAAGFAMAGIRLCCKAQTAGARRYGVLMCLVTLGSASYHATSGNTGFLMDIVPMAASGGLLLHTAIHVMQLHANQRGSQGESVRFAVAAGAAALAVWVPWALREGGFPAPTVWAVWAVLFGSLGAIFGVIALLIFNEYADPSGTAVRDVKLAVAFILSGLLCTVHSFIPGLCSGALAQFPFHALWHVFSAVSAFKTGRILDAVLRLMAAMEQRAAEKQRKRSRSLCPLLVRMIKDAMPSQFSM